MTSNPYAKIKQNSVMTASAQDLTLMLYDGAIKYANQAIVAIEHKQYDVAHAKIMRVQDIIQEFIVTLDPNYEISTDMRRLYDYLYQRLVQANARKKCGNYRRSTWFSKRVSRYMETGDGTIKARNAICTSTISQAVKLCKKSLQH